MSLTRRQTWQSQSICLGSHLLSCLPPKAKCNSISVCLCFWSIVKSSSDSDSVRDKDEVRLTLRLSTVTFYTNSSQLSGAILSCFEYGMTEWRQPKGRISSVAEYCLASISVDQNCASANQSRIYQLSEATSTIQATTSTYFLELEFVEFSWTKQCSVERLWS